MESQQYLLSQDSLQLLLLEKETFMIFEYLKEVQLSVKAQKVLYGQM